MVQSRWLASVVLAAGLGVAAIAPAPAQAQDITRVLVDVADVVLRGGTPYYRHGSYREHDRLVMQRDRYNRPVYYRVVPRYQVAYRNAPPYGNAYGHGNRGRRDVKCNKHGKCKATYYDPRHDRDRDDDDDRRRDHDGRRGW